MGRGVFKLLRFEERFEKLCFRGGLVWIENALVRREA